MKRNDRMSVIIQSKRKITAEKILPKVKIPEKILKMIPKHIGLEIEGICRGGKMLEEIRLRSGNASSVTVGKKNIFLKGIVTKEDIDSVVSYVCDGSPYAYSETIKKGYITLCGGIRIGICGRAAVEEKKIIGVKDITGLNIRIPSYNGTLGKGVAEMLLEKQSKGGSGALIYSPSGEGKTTLLKNLAVHLSSGVHAKRVVIVDTRDELSELSQSGELCLDILSGYPKAEGIEIATRTMNAEFIICDEIGDQEEVEAILSSQNCGVPIIASAHGGSVAGILHRSGIRRLHESMAFDTYIGIKRKAEGGEYDYNFTPWEAANEYYGI